jgi:pimeloyl-ACP methyl ester carboxylesterase
MNGITVLRATFGAHLADFLEGTPAPARSGPSRAGPIVLLHGFAGWSRGLLPLERHLRAATGREVVRLRLGAGLDGIEPLAQRAAASIERIAAEWRGRAVDVVGHSMGGLVATYAAKHLDPSARVRRVVTLGTPHRGTALALSGARFLGRVAGSLAQMVPGSAFLADLDRAALPQGVSLVSVAGLGDLVVPAPCARLPRRARHHNRSLAGSDHWGLVFDAPAQALVVNLLRGTPLAPGKAARPAPRARRIGDGRDRLRVVE